MKSVLKTLGTILLLIVIALCFGLIAHTSGYQIKLSHYYTGNTTADLGPDFSLKVGTMDRIFSVLYIIVFMVSAFFSGKRGMHNLFRGMMIYSALPYVGLIGYFFLRANMKLGILMLMTLIWGYPYFPLIINENSIDATIVPLGIMMVVIPLGAYIAHRVGKKLQY